ncbi:uncharacterized protein LOC128161565 isoform X2 [Crassostrea angulata]|uniref:uncharacterized protein LOC128161565 isoform X2 n=1 Tax=Magallana angulata TaxID=2784310 RepID=UPI0022B12EFA|nr:uncharacterized protein LOC128161565 isoform X2 [Crassostrea angulata]
MIPGLKSLRIFVLSGMIMIITSDRPWGYRRRFWSKRCFNQPTEDDLIPTQEPAFITEECPCQESSQPVTTCPSPATYFVTDFQFYLILGAGLGSFVFGVLVTIAIHAIIQRNKLAIEEKKSNETSSKQLPEHTHCGYIQTRNQHQVPGVTQGIYFFDRVEEVLCCEIQSIQILLFLKAGWSTNLSSDLP